MTEKQIIRLKDIVLYILREFSGGTDYIKLYKILYFANKEQLASSGIPIVHDNFKAWNFGPVPSFIGTTVKMLEEQKLLRDDMQLFSGVIKVRKNKHVLSIAQPNEDNIPDFSKKILNDVIKKYKYYNSKKLSLESHDEAWREAYETLGGKHNGRTIINPVMMAKCANAHDDIIELLKCLYSSNRKYYNISDNIGALDKFEDTCLEVFDLSTLPENWDGEDAEAINPSAAMNCRKMFAREHSCAQLVDLVFPTPSGTICIDWKSGAGKVSAEFSSNQIAFYYVSSDGAEVYDSPTYEYGEDALSDLFANLQKIS